MAKKAQTMENDEIEAIDLITMLSLPEVADSYDRELIVPEEEIDLMALGAEEMAAEKAESANANKNAAINGNTISTKVSAPAQRSVVSTPSTQSTTVIKAPNAKILQKLEGFENDSFENIITDISACKRCGLCNTRTNVVPGIGNQHAKLVLVGEAPGADEDAQGIPFVGKAGQHLDKILAAAGFKKEDIYICNILKCRPPNNRDPNLEEMTVCTPFLQRQLALIKPKMIACLGNIAAHYVIGPSVPGITRIHGQWFQSIFGVPTFAMYHPSYLIRSASREKGSPNWQMWQDIRALKAKYDKIVG